MNIFFMLQLLGRSAGLRRRDHWTREQIRTHQEHALRSLRDYVYKHSPFYQGFHKGLEARPLHDLPVLTKAHVMEHFNELVTDSSVHLADVQEHLTHKEDERFQGKYWINATSGTSGRRGLFLSNYSEWLTIMSVYTRTREWAGIRVSPTNRMSSATVESSVPWHLSGRITATLQSRWVPAAHTLRMDASDPVDIMIKRLNDWQPDMLSTYPSVARILASEQLAGKLHISPRFVTTAAEVLTDETRQLIEKAWNKKTFNRYSATETGAIAIECEQHSGMHIMEDVLIVEVVDSKYCPVPPGTHGDKLLVTVLFNRTQPLIRYEIDDSVRLSDKLCTCGRHFILVDDIEGRTQEIIYLPSPDGSKVAVHPIVFHRVIEAFPVTSWQVIQETNGIRLLLSGVGPDISDAALVSSIQQELKLHGAIVPSVRVERMSSIPRGPTGKAPLIKAMSSN